MHREEHRTGGNRTLLLALPGRLFFSEAVACPADLTAEQAGDLARLTVESSSPFPEEKLAVCHRHDRFAGKLLALAALRERIAPLIPLGSMPTHVVPDALLPVPAGEDGWRWIVTGDALTAVRYEQGAPVVVRGFAPPESTDDAVVLATRSNAAKRTGIPESGPAWRLMRATAPQKTAGVTLHWREVGVTTEPVDHGQDARVKATGGARINPKAAFHSSQSGAGEDSRAPAISTFMSAADLDAADVRPVVVVAALRREATNARHLALTFKGLGAVAALLVVAQISLGAMHAVAARREAALDDNRPQTEGTEAKAALLDTLGKVTDRRTPQLEWLAALNAVRPDSVWLRRIAVDDKGIVAAGNARSMESLNGWLSALRQSKDFSEVAAPRISTAGQVVSFDLRATSAKTRIHAKDTAR